MSPDASDYLLQTTLGSASFPTTKWCSDKEDAGDNQLIQSKQVVGTGIFPFFFLLFKRIFFPIMYFIKNTSKFILQFLI